MVAVHVYARYVAGAVETPQVIQIINEAVKS